MRSLFPRSLALAALVFLSCLSASAGEAQRNAGRGHRAPEQASVFHLTVPDHAYDLILTRPERESVTLSVLAYQDSEGWVAYGAKSGEYPMRTPRQSFKKGLPVTIVLGGLEADTRYYYQLRVRRAGEAESENSPENTFHTARAPGQPFTFTMTADSHLDEHTTAEVYLQTLANLRSQQADFHLDLGNLFMTDKHAQRAEAAQQYLAQRYYLGQIGGSTPIFLALSTHDGEASKYEDGSDNCLAAWAAQMRTRYFPNPIPDRFYTGNSAVHPHVGLLQNYYAWQWGDALFVVLDPFRYSSRDRMGDGWGWSLGQEQYRWLEKTLDSSRAKFKFVVIHNLLCGDQASRGGVEIAGGNEWGGKNRDGSEGFRQHRPGWSMPVHPLLVRHHVAAVFKAHDNFYARQELDGIVYQMIPQPSFAGNDRIRDRENYGYQQGVFLGNSGYVRVSVTPDEAKVAYIRTRLPKDERDGHRNGEVAHEYTILPASREK